MVKKKRRIKEMKTYPSLHFVKFNLIIESYCSAFYQTKALKRLKEKRMEGKKEGRGKKGVKSERGGK